MTDEFEVMMKGLMALPHSRTLTPLAELHPETGYTWPKFSKRGRWLPAPDNPLAQYEPGNTEPFCLATMPANWEDNLRGQIHRLEEYCGRIDADHINEQIAAVPTHRELIAKRFGKGLAARTIYLAVASPSLIHDAAERHFHLDFPDHGQLVERLLSDFLRRQTEPRAFHHSLRVQLSQTSLGLGAGCPHD